MIGAASAQSGKPDGYIDVTFGHVRGPGGSTINLAGLKLPYTIRPIKATPLLPGSGSGGSFNHAIGGPPPATTVYQADAGSGYGYPDPCPSSLDDIVMTQAGVNTPWKTITFGMNVTDNHQSLIRWIIYDTYIPGGQAGQSAFSDVVADFGGLLAGQNPGTYELTVDVSPAGVVCDQTAIYVAQQFRAPQLDGNGAFDDTMASVFNPTAPPQVGSSDNVFWYDVDDTGIYDDTMQDNFGDTNYANFLFAITVAGSQDTLVPFTYTVDNGTYVSGDVTSLWYTDASYLTVRGKIAPSLSTPVARVTVEGLASSTTATSITFSLTSGTTNGGGTQKIELFNYQTNAWDLIDTENLPVSDQTYNITVTSSPSKYVNQSTRHVKARVSAFKSYLPSLNWVLRIDKTNWIITHP
ncbi:MAG TPA: hypothetical protein VHE55_13550 [Fimbriimonadaceae bacterium]|nr:hypothetical protein [Fimbriimonadaceae bacterium]